MSTAIPPRPRVGAAKRRFSIVASQFNPTYVQGLLAHLTEELKRLSPSSSIFPHHVPGAFEIPVVVRELALQKRSDAIIALGVIIKGETDHAEHLARSVTDALQRLAVDYGVPIINAVLSFENEFQARERCLGENINRGTEAARAAVEISSTLAHMREKA